MQTGDFSEEALKGADREEIMSALFMSFVMNHANTALIFLGKIPAPDTGENIVDLHGAKLFIDTLEMVQFKSKGNLTSEETAFLEKTLTELRLAFVAAMQEQASEDTEQPSLNPENQILITPPGGAESSENNPKKFTRKF